MGILGIDWVLEKKKMRECVGSFFKTGRDDGYYYLTGVDDEIRRRRAMFKNAAELMLSTHIGTIFDALS